MEYLYQQTGKVLQDYKLAIEESETTEVGVEVDEGYAELEEFQDITVPTFDTDRTPAASSQALVSAESSPTPPATSPMSLLSVVPPSPVTSPFTSSTSSLSVVPPSPVHLLFQLTYRSVVLLTSASPFPSHRTLNQSQHFLLEHIAVSFTKYS